MKKEDKKKSTRLRNSSDTFHMLQKLNEFRKYAIRMSGLVGNKGEGRGREFTGKWPVHALRTLAVEPKQESMSFRKRFQVS